jgi:hypothetical protein
MNEPFIICHSTYNGNWTKILTVVGLHINTLAQIGLIGKNDTIGYF